MTGSVLTVRSARVAGARRLLQRKVRRAEQKFLVDGPQSVREAVEAGVLLELFVSVDATEPAREVGDSARHQGVPVHFVEAAALAVLSGSVTPQGVVGVATIVEASVADVIGGRLVVLLDSVADPGNLGTVIRVADAAGADGVVVSRESVDPHNDKCIRASAGSLFHLPVVTDVDLVPVIGQLKAEGFRVLGTSGSAHRDLDALTDSGELASRTAWVLGNEAHGLDARVAQACDELVRIPIHGRAESLNLATAAAVLLYASAREQRGSRGSTR